MPTRSIERAGALATLALHAGLAAALLSYGPSRQALLAAVPIVVDLITPPRIEPERKPPVDVPSPKPRPQPIPKPALKAPEPPPVIAVPVEAPSPSPIFIAPPPPEPAPPPPPPAPAPVVVAPTPPVFTADYLENPPPAYPAMSRRLGEQGRVLLRVRVNAGGRADEIQILESSGHARLDNAARDTVRAWRFVPAQRGALPVSAWVLIPISFRLEG